MKKSLTLFLAMTFALLMLSGCNEKKSEPEVPVQSVTLSVSEYAFSFFDETLQLEATVLPADATNPKVTWKSSKTEVATVSDNGLVTSVGNGTATITATADGKNATCEITVDKGFIKDICGNRYSCVKIGNQVWMTENMRCKKYDTQSERKGADITEYSYLDPKSYTFNPYCIDASNENNWSDKNYVTAELSQQVGKLGLMYNWAAVVGYETAEDVAKHTSAFSGNRQGICPNGWHVPTFNEWNAFIEYCGGIYEAVKLRSKSGWFNGGNGTDDFLFASLPAGYGVGSVVSMVGAQSYFWTASTPGSVTDAYYCILQYNSVMVTIGDNLKSYALSVRCVRD